MEITPLAQRLAALAGLDAAKMVAGELSEADWSSLSGATAALVKRHPDQGPAISELIARIDAAYTSEVSP